MTNEAIVRVNKLLPGQLLKVRCPSCGRTKTIAPAAAIQKIVCTACGGAYRGTEGQPVPIPLPPPAPNIAPVPGMLVPSQGVVPAQIGSVPAYPTSAPPAPAVGIKPPSPPASKPDELDLIDELEPFQGEAPRSHLVAWLIAACSVALLAMAAAIVAIVYAFSRPPPATVAMVAPTPVISKPQPTVKPAAAASVVPASSLLPAQPAKSTASARTAGFVQRTPSSSTPATPPRPPEPAIKRGLVPVTPAVPPFGPDLDAEIGKSIDKGMTFLLSRFNADGELIGYNPKQTRTAGEDALAVYALLQAGEATNDDRVGPNSPIVAKMLDALKRMPMETGDATYSQSLRSAALSVYHRAEDRKALQGEVDWLVKDCVDGAFTYSQPAEQIQDVQTAIPRNRAGSAISAGAENRRRRSPWDNSNSQYGALGVWSASETQIGIEVPSTFWPEVHQHWVECQLTDGEWGYNQMFEGARGGGRLSMTVAGITTLFVAEDNMDIRTVATTLGRPPFSAPLQKGLDWLETGDHSVDLPAAQWETYNLYGLERAALASGFKYFGIHDWYRELAVRQIAQQGPGGAWGNGVIDTSYSLLFLSRGRHPVLMNKLRFDGFWANRPRDLLNLARFTSKEMERPINWQVVSLKSDWSDWMDAPILYIASHEALKFSDEDCQKLRAYADNGGLIFTHADGDTLAVTSSVANLCKRIFPEYKFGDLSKDDPIYKTQYKLKPLPRLMGVSNGSRLLLVHSPVDLNKAWQLRDWTTRPDQFKEGIDLFIYAAGKVNLKNKLKTAYVPEPRNRPIASTTVARIKYDGAWNPEPAALPRFARLFLSQTSIKVNVVDTDAADLDFTKTPMAFLTGTGQVRPTKTQLDAIHKFVSDGGVLLIDPCGGSSTFTADTDTILLPQAFPGVMPGELPFTNPIRAGTGAGMQKLAMHLRPSRAEINGIHTLPVQMLTVGKGAVVICPVDITTGLLGTNTWPVNGYDPDSAYDIAKNVLLFTVERDGM
jgi:ribosomal protein S27E